MLFGQTCMPELPFFKQFVKESVYSIERGYLQPWRVLIRSLLYPDIIDACLTWLLNLQLSVLQVDFILVMIYFGLGPLLHIPVN